MTTHHHPDHTTQLARLNRISGQLDGVRRMIEERRYCPDILTQIRAMRSALKSVEANILEAHLGACVKSAMQCGDAQEIDQKVEELKTLFKRFEE